MVPARNSSSVCFDVSVTVPDNAVMAAKSACPWNGVRVDASDVRVQRLINTSLHDLDGLRMSIPALPEDRFLAVDDFMI